jgi:hypothetical protein
MTLAGYQRAEAAVSSTQGKPRVGDLKLRLACAAVEHGIKPVE